MAKELRPFYNVYPGKHLEKYMKALKWNKKELASRSNIPVRTISEILKARQPVTEEIASSFAQVFDTSKELWLNMEESYQHRKLEEERAKEEKRLSKFSFKNYSGSALSPV